MQATIKSTLLPAAELPEALRCIPEPPHALYMAGTIPGGRLIGMVGSRRASAYGQRTATTVAAALARHGIVVVSGLAFGIDSTAHKAALDAGGRTVAVLPSGLHADVLSPRSNLALAHRIVRTGALMSEYGPDVMARKENYHARNRLISGLSEALVVVEAAVASGTMITARHAMEQGRDVWAVPGQIDQPVAEGANLLISEGAHPLVNVSHFLESLGLDSRLQVAHGRLSNYFGEKPRHVDEVAKDSGHAVSELQAELTKQELSGMVTHVGGGFYVAA